MVIFPNAKINLGLWVVEKRKDGYHNLESCFYPVPWKDILEFVESDELRLTQSGLSIPGNWKENILVKTYQALTKHVDLPPLHIHIHKQIPMGAGLGGGSSDASFLLKALNTHYELKMSISELQEIAGSLGADCPFFIENTEKMVFGVGNIFKPISIDLHGKWITLIYPGIPISTPLAFQELIPQPRKESIEVILKEPVTSWKELLTNDFEAFALRKEPQLGILKEQLYRKGADYVSMSGSGSCFYAISSDPIKVDNIPKDFFFSAQL